jgi:hypothetical protein
MSLDPNIVPGLRLSVTSYLGKEASALFHAEAKVLLTDWLSQSFEMISRWFPAVNNAQK